MQITLRNYQIKFISDISAAHKNGHIGVIGQMPTGAGKTICLSRIAKALSDRNGKILIVVHRDELVRQTCRKLKIFGLQHGVIASGLGKNRNPTARIQVAMVQTISRKIEAGILTEYNYVIFDEAHLAAAKSYMKIIQRWPNARRLGLSATPWRLDGQGLGVVGSVVVKGPTINDLINEGSLVPFITYSIPVANLDGAKIVRGEYDTGEIYQKATVVGDVVDHYKKRCVDKATGKGRSCIVFASGITHSKKLRDKFLEQGFTCEHIDGSTPTETRVAVLKRLDSGETTIVCNYGCLTEGFDSPIVSAIVIARKTASSGLFRQMCGRGLRPNSAAGKVNCIIHDHGGNAIDHGNLDYEVAFSLSGKEKATIERLCKTCKDCAAVCDLNAKECHVCGESFLTDAKERKVKEAQGELVAIASKMAPVVKEKPKRQSGFTAKNRAASTEEWLSRNGWG